MRFYLAFVLFIGVRLQFLKSPGSTVMSYTWRFFVVFAGI